MKLKHPTTHGALALGALAIGLAVGGCTASPQENVSQACSAADNLAATLGEFRGALTPNATIEQLQSARNNVDEAYASLVTEAQDVAADRIRDLDSTLREFRSAVVAVPDDAKVPEAIDSLRNEADVVGDSLTALESELKC